jgi:hypothetical protein
MVINNTPYILHFEEDKLTPHAGKHQVVRARSLDEAATVLYILGDTCRPLFSEEYRHSHPELFEKVMAISNSERSKDVPFDIFAAASLLQRLPLDLNSLIDSHIALSEDDPTPPLIEKKMVHKTSESNVLISEPFSCGNLHYFNMFLKTTELVFDHPSDHVQGMLIFEAIRQAGIATAHLQGLPMDGVLALLVFNTNFLSFVESGSPIVLRSYSNFYTDETEVNKDYYVCVQALQWGKVCSETVIKSVACMSSLRKQKINDRLDLILSRNKANFTDKLKDLFKTESKNECESQ